jgi:hypothetical protein
MRPGTPRIFQKNSIFSNLRVIEWITRGAADVTAGQFVGREGSEEVNGEP